MPKPWFDQASKCRIVDGGFNFNIFVRYITNCVYPSDLDILDSVGTFSGSLGIEGEWSATPLE